MEQVVEPAPHPLVLRHGDEEQPAGSQRLTYLPHHLLVLGDVLNHVEGADDVELPGEGNVGGVELDELNPGQPPARVAQPADVDL